MSDDKDESTDTIVESGDVATIVELLEECGVEDYDQRVIGMLVDAQMTLTTKLLEMTNAMAKHNGKTALDETDVQTAAEILGLISDAYPGRQRMVQLAAEKNATVLPQIRHNFGLKLPNDRFCQLQQNVTLKPDDERIDNQPQQHMRYVQRDDEGKVPIRSDNLASGLLKRKAFDDFD